MIDRKINPSTYLKISTIYFVLLFFTPAFVLAKNNEFYIKTQYEKRIFETEATIVSKAPPGIILDIERHLRRLEIDALHWATKGLLSGDDESKNLIQAEYRGGEYDPNTGVFDFFIDIHFRRRVFENIRISMLMESGRDSHGHPFIKVKLQNPNFFLRSAGGTLTIRQTGGKRQFVVLSSVRFARFFSMFITTANYSSVAEWRIQTLLENLKEEADRR